MKPITHVSNRVVTAATVLVAGSMIWAASPAMAADVIVPPGSSKMPAGAIDCTPRADGSPVPRECTQAPGQGSDSESFDTSNIPGMEITPGAARTATTFNLRPMIAALGKYASLPIFYVDFGDGTGFGGSGDLKALGSFPSSHVYVNSGTYKVTGYASMNGRTESTSATVTIVPAKEEPAAAKETQDWQQAATPAAKAVVPVAAADRGGSLNVGTAVSSITERTAKAAAATEGRAPQVNATTGQTTLVNIASLPAGSTVNARVKIGKTWTTLPASQVATNGVLTLPALTFTKAGTYPVKLTLSNGSTRYVKVKVNKG
jgi:hypothetical protein